MELRNLTIFLGLCLLAATQNTDARHSIHRRDTNYDDIFAADEASEDEGTQNDTEDGEGGMNGKEQSMIRANITTRPTTYEISIGADVRLECNVEPDSAVVQWSKGSEMLFLGQNKVVSGERHAILPNSKDLVIRQVDPSDGGVYRCEVIGTSVNISHTVLVLQAPEITRFTATNNGNIVEGNDLLLTCNVVGMPPPTIVWSRTIENGNERLGEQDAEFSANSAYMKNVKREHAGKYYCYAFNSVGHNQSELRISVVGKPRVHVHKTVVNSAINVEAVLQCSARYEANPHIRWYKDGLLISDSSSRYTVSTQGPHSNLTVTPAADTDFGTFTCEAENNVGKHNRSIELVQRPVVEALGAESGRLGWTVHSHQPLQEIRAQIHQLGENTNGEWKEFEIPLPSDRHHRYEFHYDLSDKLDAGRYEALVKVKNDHSWSDNVDPVVFDIEIEPQYIQHASVFGGDAHSIRPSSIILSTILMYVLVRLF